MLVGGAIPAADRSGRAGRPANRDEIAARFEERRDPPTFVDWLRSTYSYSLIDQLIGKLTIANPQQKKPTPGELVNYESIGIDAAKLSDSIVQNYLGNYEIVGALAQKYGFKYFFFLPPLVSLGNKPLTPEEQEMKHRTESEAAFYKLHTAVYQTFERESSKYQNLYSMIHIIDRYDSLIWIDEGHATT